MSNKKTTANKLTDAMIEALDSISDGVEETDGHPGNSLTHGYSNPNHNNAIKFFMQKNLMERLFVDNVGRDGKVYLSGYNWLVQRYEKAQADVKTINHQYRHPEDSDVRPTKQAVENAWKWEERFKNQVEVAETFLEALQATYIHFMGYPFEPAEAEESSSMSDEDFEKKLKSYG